MNNKLQELFNLEGKNALVTGSARGIGFVIARYLGLAGARVIINDINAAACHEAIKQLKSDGIEVKAAVFDVTDKQAILDAEKTLCDDGWSVDILVSNAGIQVRKLFADISENEWQSVLNTHVNGAYLCSQIFLPKMVQRGFGRLIFMSSVAGQAALPNISAYVAAKGAITSLTRSLAVEYAAKGITCNALAPGFIETQFTNALQQNAEFQNYLQNAVPAQRWGKPEDLAPAVIYLASDSASFVNGHVLTIDGGLLSKM